MPGVRSGTTGPAAAAARPVRPATRPLPYLWDENDQRRGGPDLELAVLIAAQVMRDKNIRAQRLSLSSTQHIYWSVAQLTAHYTSDCDLRPGDLVDSGTISTPTREGYGSLLEITRGGSEPITLQTGETRTFLLDGDEIILQARARYPGTAPVGFGECRAVVQPAPPTAL